MPNLQFLGYVGLALSFSAAVVAPLFAGCGSSVNGGNGGNGGQGVGGHAVGGHAVGGHGGHDVVIGGGGGGTAVDCVGAAADESAAPVYVRFVNHTSADIYVGSPPGSCQGGSIPYTFKDPQGGGFSISGGGPCGGGCSSLSCTSTCTSTSTCFQPYATRITPQSAFVLTWEGTVLEERKLPASCFSGSCGDPVSCVARVKPPAVPLTFIGAAWTDKSCGGLDCTCTPNEFGTCVIDYATTAGDAVEGTGTLAPGATTVDVVFQ